MVSDPGTPPGHGGSAEPLHVSADTGMPITTGIAGATTAFQVAAMSSPEPAARFGRTYSRRCSRSITPPASPSGAANGVATSVPPSTPPLHPLVQQLTKPVDSLLKPSTINKRRSKTLPVGSLPCRSRRVAGAAPCSPGPILTDAQRRIIRSLGLSGSTKKVDQQAQDAYGKLFDQPLSESHINALTALFGWTTDEEMQDRAANVSSAHC